jgi:endo-1,4-beta-xylanase
VPIGDGEKLFSRDALSSAMARREFAALGLATPLFLRASIAAAAQTEEPSLHSLAAAKGMRFGTAVNVRSIADSGRAKLVRRECGIIVAENEFKFPYLRPDPKTTAITDASAIVSFAKRHKLALRGHNLLWNRQEFIGNWLAEANLGSQPAVELDSILLDHADGLCRQFPNVVSWDVVNETIEPETGALRDTIATRLLGDAIIGRMFEAAHNAAPTAELVYNDYMGWNPNEEKHRTGVLKLLERMRKRAVPCTTLGIQGHIAVPDDGIGTRPAAWRQFLQDVRAMEYRIAITEFDVDDRHAPADPARRDEAVAAVARIFLEESFAAGNIRDLLCWGLDDEGSWLQQYSARADKLPQRCLPYDAQLRPKPLRAAIADALRAAPAVT